MTGTSITIEDRLDRLQPTRAASLLLWCILAFFVAALAWATFTKLERTTRASGRVIPSARLQTVSNLEGGVVARILVAPGDIVKAGAPLVVLDRTQSNADFGSNQANADALRIKVARLKAEMDGRDPAFPATDDPVLREQIAVERTLHRSRIADLASITAASQAQVAQAAQSIAEAEAQVRSREAAASSSQQQLSMLRPLVQSGVEPRVSLVQAEGNAQVAESDLAQARAALSRARAAQAQAQAQLAQQRSDWRAKAADELAAAGGERASRERALPALADRLARTVVRSPLAGRVNRVLISTVGGTVRPGEPIAEVVPLNDNLVVEASVKPKDIAFIHLNQRAKVSITAYDSAIYGTMEGRVTTISPDAVVEERTGDSHFVVRVRTNSPTLVDTRGEKLPIGPGMTAEVSLLGERRSILSYILTPITRLTERMFRE